MLGHPESGHPEEACEQLRLLPDELRQSIGYRLRAGGTGSSCEWTQVSSKCML